MFAVYYDPFTRVGLPLCRTIFDLPPILTNKYPVELFPKTNQNHPVFGTHFLPFLGIDLLSNSQKLEDTKRFQSIFYRQEARKKFGCKYSIFSKQSQLTQIMKTLADDGDLDSMYTYGIMKFQNSKSGNKSFSEGLRYFRNASLRNHAPSQFCYAWCLKRGIGVPPNPTKAVRYFRKSAFNGYDEAQYFYGLYLLSHLETDKQQAFHLFIRSALQGNLKARFLYGFCVLNGIGVNKNIADGLAVMSQVIQTDSKMMSVGDLYHITASGLSQTLNPKSKGFVLAYEPDSPSGHSRFRD